MNALLLISFLPLALGTPVQNYNYPGYAPTPAYPQNPFLWSSSSLIWRPPAKMLILTIKAIVDTEYCYTSTRTVCAESIEEIPNEICTYNYQQKYEDTTAKNVEVTFKKETNVQMVTVCQPGYGHGYQSYGHQQCKEVAQETAYNPIKSCVNKPISLPRVSCSDIQEEKCIIVPEVQDSVQTVEKCSTRLGAPSCQKIELTLPKQVCIELVYGYAHDTEPAYAPAPTYETTPTYPPSHA
ncbi:unnamed protein product [Lepeophtheirus salmonis]|uniref:(salmon louse) hypothetical protein n=1 Tax=Lepeophtheirus salmonis TaxID=72036 RepID=A0A7R8HCD2_LEPSM|nr:unnamed protein product [Lepeophtheirus salmonis]CAF3012680.1 unnamed protein product [Lepeophtheirus salmonis]